MLESKTALATDPSSFGKGLLSSSTVWVLWGLKMRNH